MSVPRIVLAAVVALGLSACSSSSSGSPAAASSAASATSAVAAAATTDAAVATTAGGSAPAAGGSDNAFCAAFDEYKTSAIKPDLQARGEATRKAAADIKAHAPDEIKASANKFADVLDSLGKAFAEGKANDGLKAASSPEFTKALTDVAVYTSTHCK